MFNELDSVIVAITDPERSLVSGDRGVIVLVYGPADDPRYEVEVFDSEGWTKNVVTLTPAEMRSVVSDMEKV